MISRLLRSRDPWLTAATLVGAVLATHLLPALAPLRPAGIAGFAATLARPWSGKPRVALWAPTAADLPQPQAPQPVSVSVGPAAPAPPSPRPSVPVWFPPPLQLGGDESLTLPPGILEVPDGALGHFDSALARAARGEGVCRISHFADSPVTGDLISGEARAHLQRVYGSAGHGYLLPGQPWEWYGHLGVSVSGAGWTIRTPMLGHRETRVGLAGVSFRTSGRATSEIRCARWVHDTFAEIHHLALPGGGRFAVFVDDQPAAEIETHADAEELRATRVPLGDDKSHDVRIETRGDGPVTLYGVVLERDRAGVVYDALGGNGGAIFHLAAIDALHWMAALRLRRPDLVVLSYGTNESGYYAYPGRNYVEAYRTVVMRIRSALPEASILIMAPMDRGEMKENGEVGSLESLPRIVAAQRRAARELGCAFFDTYAAMGGEGSAARWNAARPALMTSDFTHPTRPGADRLARLLVAALRQPHPPGASPEPVLAVVASPSPAAAPAFAITPNSPVSTMAPSPAASLHPDQGHTGTGAEDDRRQD